MTRLRTTDRTVRVGGTALLVYDFGLEPLLARPVYADLPGAQIRRLRLSDHEVLRQARRPDLTLLSLPAVGLEAALSAIRAAWDERVLIVGVDRHEPFARIWRYRHLVLLVEVGPGFLYPYLPVYGTVTASPNG